MILAEIEQLVSGAKKGSREAFSRIVEFYQSRVRGYLSGYIRDRSAMDDLAQETFLVAYRGLAGFKGESTLGVWLIGIARNLAAMYLREKAKRPVAQSELVEDALTRWSAAELERRETRKEDHEIEALKSCIESLPPHSARLIRAFYFQGRPTRQLAEETGKTEGTLWVTLLRIRQALRQCVQSRTRSAEGLP